ncbi:MAG: DUF423 domain-containing protein [Prolixibacteraceae bacterium]
MSKFILLTGVASLVLAVVFGAFGAHALKAKLAEELMKVYKTGVEYHFYHALGLVLIGILSLQFPSVLINWSGICLIAGLIFFSGSLYVMALTGFKWLGALTPLGGLCFIGGWILLFLGVWKNIR